MRNILEVIGFNIESCKIAQNAGADRIELCDNPYDGGTTPSFGFIRLAREVLQIPLFPIIRPRGGDFFYTSDEFEIMKHDIKTCKSLGCDGVVFGILNEDGTVDNKRNEALANLAYPMSTSFHRAFDRVENHLKSLEDIIDLGFERILTSGLAPNIMDGLPTVIELVQAAAGRISIMPGSGITSDNILEIASKTGTSEFHSSARTLVSNKMIFQNIKMNEELQAVSVSEQSIVKMKALLNNLQIDS